MIPGLSGEPRGRRVSAVELQMPRSWMGEYYYYYYYSLLHHTSQKKAITKGEGEKPGGVFVCAWVCACACVCACVRICLSTSASKSA